VSLLSFNDKELERALRRFGEEVTATRAALPALPEGGWAWRLVTWLDDEGPHVYFRHRWCAEQENSK
jgi:hypothetical protein